MRQIGANVVLSCCLLGILQSPSCLAQMPDAPPQRSGSADASLAPKKPQDTDPPSEDAKDADPNGNAYDNELGVIFLKHLVSDQKAIWTSPAHLRWSDGSWLFPLAAVTAGLFATDRAVPPALSGDQAKLNHYVTISDYGLYSMIAAGGGLYVLGKLSHDDHEQETGLLAGEAAINSLAVNTAIKYAFGRSRPYQDSGQGEFFQHGTSFASDHAVISWSIASVLAHEYPNPLMQIAAYGLATTVSAMRVRGEQHFPSDVVVGGAIGWLIGWYTYRAHHDPEVGGGGWAHLGGSEDGEDHRDRQHMGSPSVPLDSWVYPAFERLAALRVINTQLMGLKPWTRLECARLTEEASETLQQEQVPDGDQASQLQMQLAQEFAYEINLLGGGRNLTANLESVYVRGVSISGPALTDGYHFGQTISYDFGRPFERGMNGQAGGAVSASAGPLTLYVRAEYQHAPSAPALSSEAVTAIANADMVPVGEVPAGPLAPINRIQLLDAYAGVNLGNWQLTLGKQSLSWTPGPDGSMLWSDNVDPVSMVRLVNPEPLRLPSILKFFGPVRIDQFFGRLEGHPYVPHPFEYGQKISMKPLSFLELGFARTVTIGGQGSLNPMTGRDFYQSFFGLHNNQLDSVPGDAHTEMDWAIYVPGVDNYFVFYGDAYADDDILPIKNPPKNPWHPGLYITRFPGLSKLDFHVEGVATTQPGLSFNAGYMPGTPGNRGQFNYWNFDYRDGYTNGGDLIGNTVGRDGQAIQGWFTYWLTPRNNVQVLYKNSSVAEEFMPGGAAWQDYSVSNETHLQSGFYVKAQVQYENISKFPVLFNGPQKNITAILEVGFTPGERGRK